MPRFTFTVHIDTPDENYNRGWTAWIDGQHDDVKERTSMEACVRALGTQIAESINRQQRA